MNILLALTILFAPAYILKFTLFGFPTNLLMVWVFYLWIACVIHILYKQLAGDFIQSIITLDKKILIPILLFFLSGVISLLYPAFDQKKLGQFIVLILQPISLFFIYRYEIKNNPNSANFLLSTFYFLLAASGLYAIIQYFTLTGLPPQYWGNANEPKRALSFFVHPNFYALFVAPPLAFLIPDLRLRAKGLGLKVTAWIIGAVGLFLSLSRAGWIGLAAAIAVYVLIAGNKTIKRFSLAAVIVIVIVIVSTPVLRYRILLPFYGEKSAVSRLSLWHTGWKGIQESPILGLGLTGFSQNWNRLNTDPNLDSHNFPHNIFLNFWLETGLLGLASIMFLIGLILYRVVRPFMGIRNTSKADKSADYISNQSSPIHYRLLPIALFLITFIVQGLMDNPYFKNDLAIIFWIILSFI